jgi:transcriptional regulator with XRE-family HTH domain
MKGKVPPYQPMDEFWKERMKDAEFVAALQEIEPEFQAAKEVLRLRLAQGLTQEELAERIGTKQASISRLERASYKPNLGFLQRVAEALNARVEIHLVPKEQTLLERPACDIERPAPVYVAEAEEDYAAEQPPEETKT